MGLLTPKALKALDLELAGGALAFRLTARATADDQVCIVDKTRRDLVNALEGAMQAGHGGAAIRRMRRALARSDGRAAGGVSWQQMLTELVLWVDG